MLHAEYLIVGCGPGGLQLAYYLAKAGRRYLILERAAQPGSFFATFPRHRTLISANKIHTGNDHPERRLRFDWNSLLSDCESDRFVHYSARYFPPADDLVRYLTDFAGRHGLAIRYNTSIVSIAKVGDEFCLMDADRHEYWGRRLVIATGNSKPFIPEIPGSELTENYTQVSVDPIDFVNQRVLIIGKGNSAFETANNLLETAALIHLASPSPLKFAWKTHFVGHLRSINTSFLDTYQLKLENAIIDATIDRIQRRPDGKFIVSVAYTHAGGEREDLLYDRVISCTGFRFDHAIFDASCRPALTIRDRFPEQTAAWESTNVNGLFFAGALTQALDFKRVSSGFIHGFRYNSRALWRILENRFHGTSLPHRIVEASPEALVEAVSSRINSSSALWQQFGLLADAIEIMDDGGFVRYYEELPAQFILESEIACRECFLVTLEFGKIHGDPFQVARNPDPSAASESTFLHPIVRRFVERECVEEVHLLENLFGEWLDPEAHLNVLLRSFRSWLRTRPQVALKAARA
jgi:thioredoxin reductase